MRIFFFNNGLSGKIFILENLLQLKYLRDKGFDVSGVSIDEPILDDVWHILFEKVQWDELQVEPPPELKDLDKDDDKRYYIEDYISRDHYTIEIEIKELRELAGKIRPKHYRELMSIVKKVCAAEDEDYEELTWELIRKIDWLVQDDGKIVGLKLHFIDIKSDWENPYCTIVYCKAFLKFWDTLQGLRKRVAKNLRINNNRNPGGQYRLGKGAKRATIQRKANRPAKSNELGQRVA